MRPAFVTGGSSGIGLAAARRLAQEGRDIALFARDAGRLTEARNAIAAAAPECRVLEYPVDVSARSALSGAVQSAIAALGAPEVAIASAGIVEPGLFTEQTVEQHERHMAVNYFGALYFTHAVTGAMAGAGGGRIGLISSGAAFLGIYGYGAYGPSKFALKGLAEVLHLELAEKGIGVTICYPPDTDTPMLATENATKPLATQKITAGGGLMQPDAVAAKLLDGMARGRFEVAPGVQMGFLNRAGSLAAPLLRWHQRRMIRKYGP